MVGKKLLFVVVLLVFAFSVYSACNDNDMQCSADGVPQKCGANGVWQDQTKCTAQQTCSLGKCEDKCTAGAKRCGAKGVELCQSDGSWKSSVDCKTGEKCNAKTLSCLKTCNNVNECDSSKFEDCLENSCISTSCKTSADCKLGGKTKCSAGFCSAPLICTSQTSCWGGEICFKKAEDSASYCHKNECTAGDTAPTGMVCTNGKFEGKECALATETADCGYKVDKDGLQTLDSSGLLCGNIDAGTKKGVCSSDGCKKDDDCFVGAKQFCDTAKQVCEEKTCNSKDDKGVFKADYGDSDCKKASPTDPTQKIDSGLKCDPSTSKCSNDVKLKSKDECFITQDFDSATRTCKDKTCTEGEWLCDANNKGSYVVCGKDKKYGNGQFCESGVCDAASKSCLECKDDTDCNSGKKCQANKCVDTGKTKADGDWNADKKVTVDDLTVIKGKIGDFVSYIKSLITGKSDLAQETHKYLKKMEKNWNAGS